MNSYCETFQNFNCIGGIGEKSRKIRIRDKNNFKTSTVSVEYKMTYGKSKAITFQNFNCIGGMRL